MNSWQMAQQIKHELAQVAWTHGSAEVVFGPRGVLVYAGSLAEDAHPPGFPFALVTIGGGTPDPDDPDLIEQQFSVITAVQVAGDPMGQNSVIGSSRADYGKSAGAGIAEVGERVRYALERLTSYDGASIIVSGTGIGSPASMGRGKQHAFDEYTVTALCTSRPHYPAPEQLRFAGGIWTWTDQASSRFDFLRYRLGYVAGSTPASSPDDINVIYTGTEPKFQTAAGESATYQVFADYNGHGGTSVSVSSPASLGSYVAS
jgi:hypothetical protein